jgi:acetyl-CoA C-acetyltransferase
LAKQAVGGALKDAGISTRKLEALYVGNMLSGILGSQEHLGAFFADELGITGPAFKIEGACASGGLAVHNAVNSVIAGVYKTVAVLGIEKMTDFRPEEVAAALMGAGSDEERASGITFPGLYACLARAHMEAFGTTEEDMAEVAVKNHFHAGFNPNAQFHAQISVVQVMKSSCVADPLKLLDCSPISDGAAAIIITSDRKLVDRNQGIRVAASSVATDSLSLAGRKSLTELAATKKAAVDACKTAGIDPGEIDVAEVHDCFTIAEILAMEDLGFYKKGQAAEAIKAGETRLGSAQRLVVNPSGGLKGCGHPVGATGVKQIAELAEHLRGRAGRRQVKGSRVALSHNVGGSGATAVVHILKK